MSKLILLWKRLFNLPVYRYDLLRYTLHHDHSLGICNAVWGSLCIAGLREVYERETNDVDDSGISIQFPHILPKFTYTNAQQFNGDFYYRAYWFPLGDWKKRKEFIRWMMEQYKDDKTDLRTLQIN